MFPKHLTDITVVSGDTVSESWNSGKIKCTCGKKLLSLKVFSDYRSNQYPHVKMYEGEPALYILAECECGKKWPLFDYSSHGYEGFVCKSGIKPPEALLEDWRCPHCRESLFAIELNIQPGDLEQFVEEIVCDSNGEFTQEDFPEAFEWIQMNLVCSHCQTKFDGWIDLETC